MRKKVKIIFALSLILFGFVLINPKGSSAAQCAPNPGVRCNLTPCVYGGSNYCCFSPADCQQLQQGEAATGQMSKQSVDIHCGGSQTGISTAIGCIDFGNQNALFGDLLRWAVGIGGGIAFLLIVYAGFMIMTAAGNPERLKAGQELLTSAISGLILLIFSVFVLKFIGIDILGLGSLGFSTQ